MNVEIQDNPEAVAKACAKIIAAEARAAASLRKRFIVALSGGRTPWQMLAALGQEEVPWEAVQVVQVDERVAPPGHPDRNLTHIKECMLGHTPLQPGQIHAMPVEEQDLEAACEHYAQTLKKIAGVPPVIDLVHLGMGPDGHTASLVPGDPVLQVTDRDVAATGIYQGRRRMTLTYPIINGSRRILWLVSGTDKAAVFPKLRAGDESIPAGRVRQDQAILVADRSAAGSST
jgi:6-phosphogluconolactonase